MVSYIYLELTNTLEVRNTNVPLNEIVLYCNTNGMMCFSGGYPALCR